jgi:hypothetical protein
MTMKHTLPVVLCAMLAAAGPIAAQEVFTNLEVGYQWVDISGNEDMYRTQLNDDNGIVVNDFSLTLVDLDGSTSWFDRFRIDASGFGGNPAGSFRLQADLADVYALRLAYRQFEHFSALPAWANPDLDDGVIPGQHTWDRDRHLLDLEIQLMPGRSITPIIGYRWNSADSLRRTTYHVGQDEFRLDSDLEETETEFRAGIAFRAGRWAGSIIQGWRNFEATEHAVLAAGAGGGNNANEYLGVDPTLDTFARSSERDASTPVTTAHVRGQVTEVTHVAASFILADGEGDGRTDDLLSGSLVSYQLNRYFQGLDDSISHRTENPFWRGDVRAGFRLGPNADLNLVFDSRHRELEGWALIRSLYLETLNFSGADPADIEQLVQINNGYERDDTRFEAQFSARDLGPFSVWAHLGTTDTDLDVTQDVAEIVLPGGQQGSYGRTVTHLALGGRLELGSVGLSAEAIHQDADDVIMRTDYQNRLRLRLRMDWRPCDWFEFLGTAEKLNSSASASGYSSDTDHWAVDLGLQPATDLWFRVAWDHYDTTSSLLIREPATWTTLVSDHGEGGDMLEGSLDWRRDAYGITAGYSNFENEGSFPFEIERIFGRAFWDFAEHYGAAIEVEQHDYSETMLPMADFEASRYAVFIRYHR